MATLETLTSEQTQQTDLFNRLRKEGADQAQLDDVKKRIQELKKEIGALKGAAGGAAGKKKERLLLKTPKVRRAATAYDAVYDPTRRAHATMVPRRWHAASTSSVS